MLNATNLQPGVYDAQLAISHTTPYVYTPQPVHLTVSIPTTWGKVLGNVSTPGYCSSNPGGLSGMTVTIKSAITTFTTTTDVNGNYQWWADANNNPYTVTVAGPNYEVGQTPGVTLVPQATIGQDCPVARRSGPASSQSYYHPAGDAEYGCHGQPADQPLNAGAASGVYTLTDKSLGVNHNPPVQRSRRPIPSHLAMKLTTPLTRLVAPLGRASGSTASRLTRRNIPLCSIGWKRSISRLKARPAV